MLFLRVRSAKARLPHNEEFSSTFMYEAQPQSFTLFSLSRRLNFRRAPRVLFLSDIIRHMDQGPRRRYAQLDVEVPKVQF